MEDGHHFGSHGNHKVAKGIQMILEQCRNCGFELQVSKTRKLLQLAFLIFSSTSTDCVVLQYIFIYSKKKNTCISEPTQFKSMLLKGQLYMNNCMPTI